MTNLVHSHLTRLAGTIADLRDRVRVAVAGELGRAVADAVRRVVEAAAAPQPVPTTHAPRRGDGYAARRDERWGYDPDDDPDDDAARSWDRPTPTPTQATAPSDTGSAAAAAVAAGVGVARWLLAAHGTVLAATGLGLGVALLGVAGGPLGRTAVAVLAAAADVFAATEALGGPAARLAHL